MDKQQQEFEALAQEVNERKFARLGSGVSREVIWGLAVIVVALIVSAIVLINA